MNTMLNWTNDDVSECPKPDSNDYDVLKFPQCAFSSSYFAARALFRTKAEKAGADRIDTLYVNEEQDLSIDIAVFKGNSDKLLLHFSGTHGVEGFVGSAIQSAILTIQAQTPELFGEDTSLRPTLVFVHAVNPFGFANIRRWNEDGIDLNRNLMNDEKWKVALDRHPNFTGYEDLNGLMNPTSKPSNLQWAMSMIPVLPRLVFDFTAVKAAMVCGTYSHPDGLFYGGNKTAKSHRLIIDWLQSNDYTESVKELVFIDVHSGLGPQGIDTLMHSVSDATLMQNVFGNKARFKYTSVAPILEGDVSNRTAEESKSINASAGYDQIMGDSIHSIPELFQNLTTKKTISFAQEFGTVSGVMVMKALIQEHQAWRYIPHDDLDEQMPWKKALKDVFNVPKRSFQSKVLGRGVQVVDDAIRFLNNEL